MSEPKITSLNEEQEKAIKYIKGPLLIVAGAGTGKTFTLVEKVRYLIEKKLAAPQEILALTFTEKAAAEMEERVDIALPYGYFQTWISTFHSFADKVLKDEAGHIGLSQSYKLMGDAESILFFKKNLFLFNLKYFRPLGNPDKFISSLLQHFSRLKDEDISPEEYLDWATKLKDVETEEKEKYLELAHSYKKYQLMKLKDNYMDFSDLIYYLLKLFRERKNILKEYRARFKFFLVDEFQDTNIAQYQLIKLLCPPESKPLLTIVGDDSQAIYKFRGASVSNILAFMDDYKKAKQISLNRNYRSNQKILDSSYRLIKNNDPDTLEVKLGISKKLIGKHKGPKDSVIFKFEENIDSETEFVSSEIKRLVQDEKRKLSDIAILVRANNHADAFVSAFNRYGIAYRFLGPGALFKQPEVKDLISYLKVLDNLEDSVSFYRVLSMDYFNIDARDISLIIAFGKKTNLPLFLAAETCVSFWNDSLKIEEYKIYKEYLPLISQKTKEKIIFIVKVVHDHLRQMKKITAGQLLFMFLEKTGYLTKLVNFKSEQEEKKVMNINKFFSRLKEYEAENKDASVKAVVEYLDMSMELGESPIVSQKDLVSYDAVNILTVHSAKGLEFPIVFLVNLTEGRFPVYEKKEVIPIPETLIKEKLPEGDYHLEEERRLFYVALTRAMDKVYLTAAKFYGEGKRQKKLSRFIYETLDRNVVEKEVKQSNDEKKQLSIFDFKPIKETLIKEKIDHKVFSFSQLETYEICPLRYKYQYIIKIPTPASAAASFGESIHKTLQHFYSDFQKNNELDKKYLLEILKKNWIPLGFSSRTHETNMKEEGEKMLSQFYDKLHKPNLEILSLEKLFKVKIDSDIYISGKIDRIDKRKNGTIEIIDYKTGKMPDEKKLKKSLQLSLYALAASSPQLLGKKLGEITLSFIYLQNMDYVSFTRTSEEIATVKSDVKIIADSIRSGNFNPKKGIWCKFCPFLMICEAWQ